MASGSITASVTTFAVEGGSSTAYTNYTLAPSAVSYAATGNVARMNLKRAAATGTLTLTGRPINVDHEWRLSTNVTTVAVTGNAATITYGGTRTITGTPTVFTATVNDATLISSVNYILFAPFTRDNIFTVIAGDSTSYKNYVLAPSPVAYTLTGRDANFLGSRLSAATGSFYVSGKAANLSPSTRRIDASTGTFTETGNAANLSRSSTAVLGAATGPFTLVGGTSTSILYTNRTLVAAKGTFVETGQPVTWGQKSIAADTGAFVLTGDSAIVARYDYHTKGTFTVTGRAIQVKYGIAASTITVSLSGSTATLTKAGVSGHVLAAVKGTFVETGSAAILQRFRTLTAAKGTFTETGRAATMRPGKALTGTATSFVLTGRPATLQRSTFRILTADTKSITTFASPAGLNLSGIRLLNAAGASFYVEPIDASLRSASLAWIDYPYIVNAADTSVRWVHLYELNTSGVTLRWTDDLLPVVSGGVTYDPYVVSVDSISTEQGVVASGALTIGNADNLFGNYIFTNDLTGSIVKIWQAWMNPFLPTQISASTRQIFVGRVFGISLSRSGQDSTARITLGPYSDPSTKIFPTRLVSDLLRR